MRYGCLAFAAGLLWSVSAQAGLLTPDAFEAKRYLPPPPGPEQTKLEMQELRDIASRSSAEDRAIAKHDAEDETADIFNAAIGLDLKTMPETFKLLTMVGDEEEDDTKEAKAYFHRDRPYAAELSIKTCTKVKPGKAANSYPSGHSTRAFAMGEVLAALMPTKSQAILARSSEFAAHRLVCGVHYRSDIVAGQQYGTILALKLMENSDFKQQMAVAARELSAQH
jgi:hypothetical protein